MSTQLRWCLVCGRSTAVVFNIELTRKPVCENCAVSITSQQVHAWVMASPYAPDMTEEPIIDSPNLP